MRQSLPSRILLRLVAALLLTTVLTAGAGCNAPPIGSPFVPIPPPVFGPQAQEVDSAGIAHNYWKVTSGANRGLTFRWVYLDNLDLGAGVSVQAAADGSYTTRIEGQRDDRIQFGVELSDRSVSWSMCYFLREGPASAPCSP
jgi:hypothetical protein